jgi:hypothetical protein
MRIKYPEEGHAGHQDAEIIKALAREHLSVRRAQARTGIAAADFARMAPPAPMKGHKICFVQDE